jgi:hypothetical protein
VFELTPQLASRQALLPTKVTTAVAIVPTALPTRAVCPVTHHGVFSCAVTSRAIVGWKRCAHHPP